MVPHHLQVDTAALRAARLSTEAVHARLQPDTLDPDALAVLADGVGGAALVAEHDRLLASVLRIRRELAELGAALGTAATALETAERHAVQAMSDGDR